MFQRLTAALVVGAAMAFFATGPARALGVDLKSAKGLGPKIAPSVLRRADEVVA